jgi:hypothetical protein
MPYHLPHVIPDPIPFNDPDLVIDRDAEIFLYKRRKLAKKRRFEILCKCGKVVIATQNYLKKKQHKFLCRSCGSVESWKNDSYREPREKHLRKMSKTEEAKSRGREFFIKKWQDPKWRKNTIANLRSEKSRKNLSDAIRRKILTDEDFRRNLLERKQKYSWGDHCDYQRLDSSTVHLKSRGEKRFAQILDRLRIEWVYEKKGFRLLETGELYFPDFYMPELDLWVEIKYTIRERDLRKFRILARELKDINLIALGFSHINKLEKICESQKLKQALLEMLETSRSLETITL